MKTKEEVIQIAYGEYWEQVKDLVNENGWFYFSETDFRLDNKMPFEYCGVNFKMRPKSLQGIDDNFGWISINSEKDLPTIGTFYTILSFDENIVEREFPHPKFTLEFNKEWWLKYVTHYQEKIMPNKPLHK